VEVGVSYRPVTASDISKIALLKELRSLSLFQTAVTDSDLKAVATLVNLWELNLTDWVYRGDRRGDKEPDGASSVAEVEPLRYEADGRRGKGIGRHEGPS
jgi:hypothetical protein